jgi:ABC-type nitrate/sulfonate/bicarbonate transport system permease component
VNAPGRIGRWLPGTLGIGGLIGLWSVLSTTVLTTRDGVPTPWATVAALYHDGWSFYQSNLGQTGAEALRGYLLGNGLALGCALLVVLVPLVERFVLQLAIASYCIPIMAVGPLLSLLFNGDTPMVAMAALSVFFTTLVGALLGLRSADAAALDLVRAYGGGRWQQLVRVRGIAALPNTLAALRVAAPAALLGAIIGEYLGRVTNGLGVAMIVSEQQFDIARTWAIALVSGAVAGGAYGVTALVGRYALPWAHTTKAKGGTA